MHFSTLRTNQRTVPRPLLGRHGPSIRPGQCARGFPLRPPRLPTRLGVFQHCLRAAVPRVVARDGVSRSGGTVRETADHERPKEAGRQLHGVGRPGAYRRLLRSVACILPCVFSFVSSSQLLFWSPFPPVLASFNFSCHVCVLWHRLRASNATRASVAAGRGLP
jgi:hypothetical protein